MGDRTRDAERDAIIAALRRWAATLGHRGDALDWAAEMLEQNNHREEGRCEARTTPEETP